MIRIDHARQGIDQSDNRRLAGAWRSGDYAEAVFECLPNCPALFRRKLEPSASLVASRPCRAVRRPSRQGPPRRFLARGGAHPPEPAVPPPFQGSNCSDCERAILGRARRIIQKREPVRFEEGHPPGEKMLIGRSEVGTRTCEASLGTERRGFGFIKGSRKLPRFLLANMARAKAPDQPFSFWSVVFGVPDFGSAALDE
jgi:hypothetical protein